MSRFTLICSLVLGLSSSLLVSQADARFAKAPPAAPAAKANVQSRPVSVTAVADLRIAPRRVVSRADVRAALVKARTTNLAAFRAYQQKGVFPSNTFKARKANVWLDGDGNFCAAATIIVSSGKLDLVNKVAEQNNFIRLADVKQGELMDWILTSGLTQDEIAMIQEPFMPVMHEPQLPTLAGPMVEPMPEPMAEPPVVLVDAKLRKAEDARLMAKYKAVDKQIVKNARKSLDQATDRLMRNQNLAWRFVNAQA